MMKKLLLFIIVLCSVQFLFAGPFVTIHSIDSETEFPNIILQVSARDADGNWLSGLDEENLLVYEDGYRVNYVQVAGKSETTELLYLVFSLDSSKSISEESFKKLKKSAVDIITASGQSERIALCRFNDKVVLLENFNNNKHNLVTAVNSIDRHGTKTLLYNAIYDSIELVSRTDSGRKAIVVFTDGKDEGSSVTLTDVAEFSRKAGVPLYIITMNDSEYVMNMKRLSKLTAGKTILIDTVDNLVLAYQKIIQNIKSQHTVKYVSMAQPDGNSHRLEVRLKYGKIRDRDIKEFTVTREFLLIEFPDYKQILLIIMLILLTLLLAVGLLYLIKRKKQIGKKKDKTSKLMEEPNFEEEFISADNLYSSDGTDTEKKHYEYYSHAWLILQKNGQRKKFPLSKDEVIIGTSYESHLIVKNKAVSPRHCSIKYMDGAYYLFDLVSDRGTYLNGKKLLRPRQLFDWDEITIGPVSFIFRGSTM